MRLHGAKVWLLGLICACSGQIDGGVWGAAGTGPAGGSSAAGSSSVGGAGSGGAGTGDSGAGASDPGIGTGGVGAGRWCAIQTLIAQRCVSCHRDPLPRNVPMKLETREDLLAPTPSDATLTVAEMSLQRMQDPTSGMPPEPLTPATADEIALIRAWIADDAPDDCSGAGGAGGAGAIPDPYDTPVVCTSDKRWTGGDEESPYMHPGAACIDCHQKGGEEEEEAPVFAFAGTAYPSAHEPTDCNGIDGTVEGAQVIIVDSAGKTFTLKPNRAGNFFYEADRARVSLPYRAKIVKDGLERAMAEPQTSGDCNACHTEKGAKDAPGRVMVP